VHLADGKPTTPTIVFEESTDGLIDVVNRLVSFIAKLHGSLSVKRGAYIKAAKASSKAAASATKAAKKDKSFTANDEFVAQSDCHATLKTLFKKEKRFDLDRHAPSLDIPIYDFPAVLISRIAPSATRTRTEGGFDDTDEKEKEKEKEDSEAFNTHILEELPQWVRSALDVGIFPFSDSLPSWYRDAVISAFRDRQIPFIFSDQSLATGANLPVRYSIVLHHSDTPAGHVFFQQATQRAGRRGLDTVGYYTGGQSPPVPPM
jgi:hypothetical protein